VKNITTRLGRLEAYFAERAPAKAAYDGFLRESQRWEAASRAVARLLGWTTGQEPPRGHDEVVSFLQGELMGDFLDGFNPGRQADPAYQRIRIVVSWTPAAALRFFAAVPSANRITVAESLMAPSGAIAWAGELVRGMTRLSYRVPPNAPPAAAVALCDDFAAQPIDAGSCDVACIDCGFPRVPGADAGPCPCCGAAGVVPARPEGEAEYSWQAMARMELGIRIGRLARAVTITS